MQLQDICIEKNFAWESRLGKAYQYEDTDQKIKTVFRYQIPFSPDKEAAFLAEYQIPLSERMRFYQTLVRCIQRQVSVSKLLASNGISSVLSYSRVEQERSSDNIVNIYLETEQVRPIMESLLKTDTSYLTLLNVVSRLALILRDINKEPAYVTHRGLDLNEVYINAEHRILLGGFFYAACDQLGPYPDYLPCHPPHIPYSVIHGEPGAHKTDIQALSFTAWNLFSGLPHDAAWATKRMPIPEYASPELVDTLLTGMGGEDEICNVFRRKLNEHRKQLLKDNSELSMIPIRKPLCKDISISWVTTTLSGVEDNTTEKEA